ncbi:MAG: RelA/SpoT domain-containing protein [Limnochordia bacterium]|jgi:ppGpp synthetase/RelA/SpoT-type nucleotidyltranferase|nr:RelA/SpoT domain-containing protein [Limnochordia bacterium]
MALISEFIDDYKSKMGHYEHLAQTCAYQCESALKRQGLRALVTSRAKKLDSLMAKVETRAQEKAYQTVDEIYEDIVDLAGVRIALYFPGDREEIDHFIRSHFHVDHVKDFPEALQHPGAYQKRFLGYVGRHYRLCLKPETLAPVDQHLANYVIELQVGSVLMHAWAEVEHDLVYKSTEGFLSQDEYAILDELNGLMHAGEIALERLQMAAKRRINTERQPFSNHYELSSYLYDHTRKASHRGDFEPFIGRTDVLFHFLKEIGLNSVPALKPILHQCNADSKAQPLAEQIVDGILHANPDLYGPYNDARIAVGRSDPYGAPDEYVSYFSDEESLASFMRQWIASEKLIGESLNNVGNGDAPRDQILTESDLEKLQAIRQIRNDILYGERLPSESDMASAQAFLQRIMEFLRQSNSEAKMHGREA